MRLSFVKSAKKEAFLYCAAVMGMFLLPFTIHGQKPSEYVNPFIGTSNYGATFPGPVVPWGMVSVVPYNVTPHEGNEYSNTDGWCSNPYVYNNELMTGFSHVNLSGVGCPDLGSILLMPTTGDLEVDFNRYGTAISNQEASPGYYSAFLDRYSIKAEATTTTRTGISRYTFPEGKANILLNLGHGLTNESGAFVKMVSDTEIEGYKLMGTFCYNPEAVIPVYFVVEFSKPAIKRGYWKKQPQLPGTRHQWSSTSGQFKIYDNYSRELAGEQIGAWYSFETEKGETIEAKVGVSYVSIENARKNLNAEQPAFDFEQTMAQAKERWNHQLSKIEVEGGSEEDKVKFYTALYHLLIHPNILQDVNGEYPAMESAEILKTDGHNRHTVFSLWDTYRNVHPLLTLVYPEQQTDMLNSMVDMYKESGWLPKWELYSRETNVMEGDPALVVLADSYLRGLTGFDVETAYEGMMKSAMSGGDENPLRPHNDFFKKNHFIAFRDSFDNTVSEALEFYVADYSLSRLALALGKKKDHEMLYERSLGYKKYFDPEYDLMRPLEADGTFMPNFDPMQGEMFEPVHGFHEGNSWQYSFAVPHDIRGLMRLMGGADRFVHQLERTFNDGLFDMSNEPDMGYPWFFNYVKGEEWRTQRTVRDCVNRYFHTGPDGLPGNDDTGTMSAWLLYSMMGFYPVSPADPVYTLSSPVFDRVTIHLDEDYFPGEKIVIESVNNSEDNIYIRKMELGGKPLRKFMISHDELIEKGYLKFYLDDQPDR
ncbi:GH92 family glycosyl hydrolase [Marinilabilia salmonicolor]|jgi:predicted alpha-1,2-mannosidase|uniref:Putative alpha-1,2-mannosidase n=1 Tax=Marinilabilia salmonicolor TaxID=989 RepID=A0A368V923_9BACT|nr:GH92 family glycosyl hydrolase [Marinilabilia salmonicolor]RCW37612.1 putative alpha-1,2-mannosidase [Marinilabilia salmonicolor]